MNKLNEQKENIFNKTLSLISKNTNRLTIYRTMYTVALEYCEELNIDDGQWGYRSRYSNIFTIKYLEEFINQK